nr:hypothetical protein [Kitasatospora cineracea]
MLLADMVPATSAIHGQPCLVTARVGDRARRHVPDFLLVMRSGVVRVVNVKPADRLADPVIADAPAWPGDLVRQHGWEYEIWSGADRVVLENVRFLAAYPRPEVVPEATEVELVMSAQDLTVLPGRPLYDPVLSKREATSATKCWRAANGSVCVASK